MKASGFASLKFRNSLILIGVMVPLFIVFLTFEVNRQSEALRKALIERGIILAQMGATTTGKILSDAIDNGALTEEQVFDTNYRPIPGTSPKKYHTQYDSYTDKNLRGIEDAFLKDKVVVYAVAVDKNGYLPTHNTKYSQPGGGLNFDRSKRIFEDTVGLEAARNTQPYKFQEYYRDTGEVMWDISAPIYVRGRHWGAFRIGFSIQETNNQVAAVVNRMIVSGVVLTMALVVLSVYLSYRISNRVKLLAEEANRVAEGDLSLSKLEFYTMDEVGSLGRSFAKMVVKLRELAEKTRYSARLIANYTRDLIHNTESVAQSANALAAKMGQVAEAMQKMEDSTERIAKTSHHLKEDLAVAETSSQKFLQNMEDSKQAMSVAHTVVSDLEFQVDKVGQFIQVVSILAEQAGMMAQKIVREASRFCAEGNEMSALAAEVKSNAEDAARTTKDVSELFQTVRDYARQASKTLEGHQGIIIEGIKVARLSSKSLSAILTDMQTLADLTRETMDYSRQLVESVKGISTDVEAQTGLVRSFAEAAGTLEQVVHELQETLDAIKV